jgi:uncharacterized protein (TIGR00661 family)
VIKIKIAIFISDHGYGHAARVFVYVQIIKSKYSDSTVFLVAKKVNHQISQELELYGFEIKTVDFTTEYGILNDYENIKVDPIKTLNFLPKWVENQIEQKQLIKKWLISENIDIVISDISPFAIEAAAEIEIKTIAISNFTWVDQYKYYYEKNYSLFENKEKLTQSIDRMKQAYMKANHYLKLPFYTKCLGFIDNRTELTELYGRISRKSSMECRNYLIELAKSQGIEIKENTIFVNFSLGKSISINQELQKFLLDVPSNWILVLVNKFLSLSIKEKRENTIIISDDTSNFQEIINGCDICISKPGYSTTAEALIHKKPLVTLPFNSIESLQIINHLKKLKQVLVLEEGLTHDSIPKIERHLKEFKIDSFTYSLNENVLSKYI